MLTGLNDMEKPIYQLQHYAQSDYPMLQEWWEQHAVAPPPVVILPKLGVIVQEFRGDDEPLPVAALFLYLDNSTGVCFLEHIVTRPGIGLVRTRDALLWGMRCLRMLAADMDYGVMFCFTHPSIARYLKREGWQTMAKERVSMVLFTKKEAANVGN